MRPSATGVPRRLRPHALIHLSINPLIHPSSDPPIHPSNNPAADPEATPLDLDAIREKLPKKFPGPVSYGWPAWLAGVK